MWDKWAIDFGHREGQWNKDVTDRLTKFEARKVSIRLYEPFLKSIG